MFIVACAIDIISGREPLSSIDVGVTRKLYAALLASSYAAGSTVLLHQSQPLILPAKQLPLQPQGSNTDLLVEDYRQFQDRYKVAEVLKTQLADLLRHLHALHLENLERVAEFDLCQSELQSARSRQSESRRLLEQLDHELLSFRTCGLSGEAGAKVESLKRDLTAAIDMKWEADLAVSRYEWRYRAWSDHDDNTFTMNKVSIILCHVFFARMKQAERRLANYHAVKESVRTILRTVTEMDA